MAPTNRKISEVAVNKTQVVLKDLCSIVDFDL